MNPWLESFAARSAAREPPAPRASADEAPYAEAWLDYRRRLRSLWLNPLGAAAMLGVIILVVRRFGEPPAVGWLFGAWGISLTAGWAYSLARVSFFRCPRCQRVFSSVPAPGPWTQRILHHDAGRCSGCGLPTWAVNDAGTSLRQYERRLRAAESGSEPLLMPSSTDNPIGSQPKAPAA